MWLCMYGLLSAVVVGYVGLYTIYVEYKVKGLDRRPAVPHYNIPAFAPLVCLVLAVNDDDIRIYRLLLPART